MKIKNKSIFFDIDNTICITYKSQYKKSRPKKKMIKIINKLYENNKVVFYTARYMGRYKGNKLKVMKKYKETNNQLIKWGFKFHKLIMGKPRFDYLFDDKAYNTKEKFFKNFVKKI
tara:strand:- start:87 stop:434 length:348 start_codon:yes stop_codon:yes gene_type:complete